MTDLNPAPTAEPRPTRISGAGDPLFDATVRFWRKLIITAAFALPIISIALEHGTRAFPDSAFGAAYLAFLGVPRGRLIPFDGREFLFDVLLSPLMAVEFNWPFIVFAARTKAHIDRYWPDDLRAHAAMIGASLGGLIPYAFLYAELPAEMLSHADAGLSIVAPFVWPIGWLCAVAGAWVVHYFAD